MPVESSGFTLIELVSVMAIVAVFATSSVPIFEQAIARHRAHRVSTSIYQQLQFARNTAMSRGEKVTLCGSGKDNQCVDKPITKILVFTDPNNNHRLDKTDLAFQTIDLGVNAQQVRLRAALGRSYIEFDASGRARQSGSFLYCSRSKEARNARRIVVSLSGRVYIARDTDGDGVVEQANGKPISCME